MKVKIEISDKNEGTSEPWWILIDPSNIKSMMEMISEGNEVPDVDRIRTAIAYAIEGPFFSREEGQEYLKRRHYEYSKDSIVWCSSGYWTTEYKRAVRESKNETCISRVES